MNDGIEEVKVVSPYKSKEERAAYQREYRRKRSARKPEGAGAAGPEPDDRGASPEAEAVNLAAEAIEAAARPEWRAEAKRRWELRRQALAAWLEAEESWRREQAGLRIRARLRELQGKRGEVA